MIKKILKTILTLSIFMLPISCIGYGIKAGDQGESDAYKFPYDPTYVQTESTTELQDQVDIGKDNAEKSIMIKLLEIFGLDTHAFDGDHKFINYARSILNMALGLLSFVALIMVIYTFYMVFFSKDDEGIQNAKKNLIGIFTALAIIGLAWLIVSFIFWRYQENWKSKQDDIGKKETALIQDKSFNNDQIYLTI